MNVRSLFSKVFGSNNSTTGPQTSTVVKLMDESTASFTPYKGDFYNDPDVRACVDAIARNGAKMHPRHIRNFSDKMEDLKDNIYHLLSKRPNEYQNAFQFYYQVISNYALYNDSFVYIQRDSNLKVTGLYPLDFSEGKYYEYDGKLYIKFKFGRSKERFVSIGQCIHLTRFVGKEGLFGGSSTPIIKALSIKHVLDEGIVNAIKTTQSIKGIVKSTKSLLKAEDVKKMRDQFVADFLNDKNNKTGIGGLDATTEFIPVKIEPTTATGEQVKSIDNKILSYFGVNEKIIRSEYSEDEWNAFYESVLEPIGLQMSLEFTNKIFTPTERYFGNEILFESNKLQYASNKTKIEVIRYCSNIMWVDELREVMNLAPLPNGEGQRILLDQNHQTEETLSDTQSETQSDTENEGGEDNNEGKGN